MRIAPLLLLGLVVAGCGDPQTPTAPSDASANPTQVVRPGTARLARYDGLNMRARVFTKHNGPRQLRASVALKFERTARGLRLTQRVDQLGKLFIGDGVELTGRVGHTEEAPPCEVGVPMEEQPRIPCTEPPCDEVGNVQPCQESGGGGEGGGEGGSGDPPPPVYSPFQSILTSSTLVDSLASAFSELVVSIPQALDSMRADSWAVISTDTIPGMYFSMVMDSAGKLQMVGADMGDDAVTSRMLYTADTLSGLIVEMMTAEGDTLSIELGPELTESELRANLVQLRMAHRRLLIEDDTCATLKQNYEKAEFDMNVKALQVALGASGMIAGAWNTIKNGIQSVAASGTNYGLYRSLGLQNIVRNTPPGGNTVTGAVIAGGFNAGRALKAATGQQAVEDARNALVANCLCVFSPGMCAH